MRRLFWISVGAAGGYYAARRGTVALEEARARGLVGNVTLAAATASRLAGSASRAATAAGEAAGSRTRAAAESRSGITDPRPTPTSPTTTTVREART